MIFVLLFWAEALLCCFGIPAYGTQLCLKEAELLSEEAGRWARAAPEAGRMVGGRLVRPWSQAVCEFRTVPRALTCSQCVLPG